MMNHRGRKSLPPGGGVAWAGAAASADAAAAAAVRSVDVAAGDLSRLAAWVDDDDAESPEAAAETGEPFPPPAPDAA
eukprot:gene25060-12759_t